MILGKIDGTYTCADAACGSGAMDIIAEDGLHWAVQCAICGTGQRVQGLRGHIKPKSAEFRFSDGRYEGMTPAEASTQANGMIYLNWAAQSHKRPAVRDACKTFLDSMNPAP